MSSASKVGEIFAAAGQAFSKLGELTMQLHPSGETGNASGKWTEKEVDMLHTSVKKFSDDLSSISENIKNRTISQIKSQMKRKAYEDAGLPLPEDKPVKQQKTIVTSIVAKQQNQHPVTEQRQKEVTLTALNAPEVDVDVDVLDQSNSTKKEMEFDSVAVPTPVFVLNMNHNNEENEL